MDDERIRATMAANSSAVNVDLTRAGISSGAIRSGAVAAADDDDDDVNDDEDNKMIIPEGQRGILQQSCRTINPAANEAFSAIYREDNLIFRKRLLHYYEPLEDTWESLKRSGYRNVMLLYASDRIET